MGRRARKKVLLNLLFLIILGALVPALRDTEATTEPELEISATTKRLKLKFRESLILILLRSHLLQRN